MVAAMHSCRSEFERARQHRVVWSCGNEITADRSIVFLVQGKRDIGSQKAIDWRQAAVVGIGIDAAAGDEIGETKDIRFLRGHARELISLKDLSTELVVQKGLCHLVINAFPGISRIELLP